MPQPLEWRQAKRLDKLCAVDAAAGPVDHVDLLIDRRKDPLEGAVPRILKTSLDRRDHWLRNPGSVRELALRQTFPLTRRPDEGVGLHIWKSISGGQPGADLREQIDVCLDDTRPGVRARDELGA